MKPPASAEKPIFKNRNFKELHFDCVCKNHQVANGT